MTKITALLYLEDNPDEIILFREALDCSGWQCQLTVARDGMEALDVLNRRNGHAEAPRPDLIVIDFNVPKKNGGEVLAEIRSDPTLAMIPVVLLSGCTWNYESIKRLGVPDDYCLEKPASFPAYVEIAKRIEGIWRSAQLSCNKP